ncbi:MAG: hypothetical protein N2112_04850 [Gemmataceae bacterium]|jgi:DNA-directed RNA polymerase subunit RPC12/RpoP|nr:hypothetical protein [Gemmataceae bacterium]
MIIVCPHCQARLKTDKPSSTGVYICKSCQGKFELPMEGRPLPPNPPEPANIQRFPPPIVIPMPMPDPNSFNPFAFVDEDEIQDVKKERREIRQERREEREFRGLDRRSNPTGTLSLAFSVAALFLMCSGLSVRKDLPAYTGTTSCLALPGALIGLILGIVGACKPGRPKLLAIIGASIAGLILLLIPMTYIDLIEPKHRR